MSHPLLDLLGREHPAFVHVPLGLVVTLPLTLLIAFRSKSPRVWRIAGCFIAAVALAGSLVTLYSGLLWGRLIALIPGGAFLPKITAETQVLQGTLLRHELGATMGFVLGLVCLGLLWRGLRDPQARRIHGLTLMVSLLWAVTWAGTGRLGGLMVFGSDEINKAAAAADAAKRNDAEADLPVRALDFASLEPVQTAPMRSEAHGDRWGRVWVTASGIDAYRAGKPLPSGAYAVLSTVEDSKGKPGQDPGPLYMRETLADGKPSFIFYWPRVPDANRRETGGEESVYWRRGDPKLAACAKCHADAGPAKTK